MHATGVIYALSYFMASLVLISLITLVLTVQGGIFDGTHLEMIEDQVKYHHTEFGAFITK